MAEYWDVYDKNRKRTGKLHKRGIRMQPGEYNIVCEAWIVSGNRLLVTQRCKYKNFGGLWECTQIFRQSQNWHTRMVVF